MLPDKIAFVDIETTGARSGFDRIIEIGILRVENNKKVKEYKTLINPQAYLPQEIELLTGIKAQDLEHAPTFREIADEVREVLDGCCFVAHNVRFDYSFLKYEFKRLGDNFAARHFCTVKLSRALFPRHRHHNLDSLIERFQIPCANRHRAFDDAHVLYEFYNKIQKLFPLEKIQKAIDLGMQRPTIPLSLKLSDLENLPELPGVYIFYGSGPASAGETACERSETRVVNGKTKTNGKKETLIPLYIGKSINIRQRVLSHFSDDVRSGLEMKISQQIKSIETITTAGELGALFLEADLIKKRMPLYNRKLRIKKQLVAIKSSFNTDGFLTIALDKLDEGKIATLHEQIDVELTLSDNFLAPNQPKEAVVGFFKSQRQAKDFLYEAAKKHGLCEKLLGLEKTSGPCFGYRLGRCKGACTNGEKPLFYNLRFAGAFNNGKIDAWPFSGPIAIKEANLDTSKSEYLVIDKWCYLGSIAVDQEENSNNMLTDYVFDLDMYKILRQYLRSAKNMKKIKLLSNEMLMKLFPQS